MSEHPTDPMEHPIWKLTARIDEALREILDRTDSVHVTGIASASTWLTAEIRGHLASARASSLAPVAPDRLMAACRYWAEKKSALDAVRPDFTNDQIRELNAAEGRLLAAIYDAQEAARDRVAPPSPDDPMSPAEVDAVVDLFAAESVAPPSGAQTMPCPHCGLFGNHLSSCEYERFKAIEASPLPRSTEPEALRKLADVIDALRPDGFGGFVDTFVLRSAVDAARHILSARAASPPPPVSPDLAARLLEHVAFMRLNWRHEPEIADDMEAAARLLVPPSASGPSKEKEK